MEQPNSQSNQTESQESNAAGPTPSPVAAALQRENPEWVREVIEALGETTIIVPREHIANICAVLKTAPDLQFNFLADLCGFDRGPEEEPRFEVNYHLFSTLFGAPLIGTSAKPTICLAWFLTIIRICAAFFCRMIGRDMH